MKTDASQSSLTEPSQPAESTSQPVQASDDVQAWNQKRSERRESAVRIGLISRILVVAIRTPCSFLTIGILARAYPPATFGLWMLFLSMADLVGPLDLGLALTLRNKLAALQAEDYKEDHRKQAETAYWSIFYMFLLGAAVLTATLFVLRPVIPWHTLIRGNQPETPLLVCVVISVLLFNIAMLLSQSVFYAYQEPQWVSLFDILRGILSLSIVAAVTYCHGSFSTLVFVFYLALLLWGIANWAAVLYKRNWRPKWISWARIRRELRGAVTLSAKFAFTSVGATLILTTDTYIVSNTQGLSAAGNYAVVQRMFSLLLTAHFFLLSPLWSAYTEAAALKDWRWIRVQFRKSLIYTAVLFGVGTITLELAGPALVHFWTGKPPITPSLYIMMGIWVCVVGTGNAFAVFLNALSRLNLQAAALLTAAAVNIPLSFWLGTRVGPQGVAEAGIISGIPIVIATGVETFGLLRGNGALDFKRGPEARADTTIIDDPVS